MVTIQKLMADVLKIPESRIGEGLEMQSTAEWDSLKHMELIVTLEQAYKVEFTGDEIAEMTSFKAIRDMLNKRGLCK